MKILYGVQGTGQGHISRSRAMATALSQWPVEVTWLFSGRARDELFDMEVFGDFLYRRGLSFSTRAGRIRHRATVANNNILQFNRDIRSLDLRHYDIIVTDYEPVVARAARRAGRKVVGIGHQYAFEGKTPRAGASWLQEWLMRHFAPVDIPIGLHWHPYADNVLPPILDLPDLPVVRGEHILVYLPFEDQDQVTAVLQQFPHQHFVQYSAALDDGTLGNVTRRRADTCHFKMHLASCAGVVCNSGFELISECLQWRKPILTKPLNGQMEQHSNALALQQLGYATTTAAVDKPGLERWLGGQHSTPDLQFPDVAAELARWLATGCHTSPARLSERLWQSRTPSKIPAPRPGPCISGSTAALA